MNRSVLARQMFAQGGAAVPNEYKGFSKLPEAVQMKMDPVAAKKYDAGGEVDNAAGELEAMRAQADAMGITLEELINKSSTNWIEPEWGFPKGRREKDENDLKCAIREYIEETGLNINDFSIVQNIIPYEEIFTGSNYKSYKHKYYLAYIKNKNINDNNYQTSEVSKIKWCSLDDCLRLIRPYCNEKKLIIKKINNLLMESNLLKIK